VRTVTLLATLEGQLIAIEGVRKIHVDERVVRISKAVFRIAFGVYLKIGVMLLWGENADIVLGLQLGNLYRFIAGLEMEEDLFVLYFLPRITKFEPYNN